MLHIPVVLGYRPRLASTRDEMWSEGRYDYERLPRERVPPRSHASDGYHRVVNVVPKRPPLLDKRPPLLDKRPPLLARPDEGGYSRYYSHVDYRECDEGRSFSHDRRSGPPHRGDEPGYRWTKDDHSTSRQPEYRDMRDGFRRKIYSSHYSRDRSPHKRDAPFFRESPVGRKDSPHSRSGSSVSSRSYSPERSRTHSFHQSQHRKSARVGASYKQQNEANPGRGKERSIQSLKTSRDTSPSSSSAVSSSKVLDKPSRLTDKELAEAESKWANEKLEKADENNLDEIAEFEVEATAPLFIDQTEEPESNTTDGTELYEDSQLNSRSKAIALKTKEIEQVYRQDCETFGMVVKMLIEKDPSLEKSIQFALRQNLHEIGERCVEELKHFITEYDNSTQDFGDPF
ncbi:periphilin-1 isoform X8 [Meriones unguiculatus]|uniref:periphilin-1 isoform X8 n=1 Tax=Meriones unguiculatus TaxID=10047 RepID=UPI000B4EA86F|nr:periphilin-1 isoform X1 [Meriones unguiculatus]XP_060244756.1 periphilin-1 isoform X8 [Meriones unguiculatus]